MAKNTQAQTPNPDVKRDFETGTVNPGPGMAPPHRANDIPAGSMTGTPAGQQNQNPAAQDGQKEEGCSRSGAKPANNTDNRTGSGGCCSG